LLQVLSDIVNDLVRADGGDKFPDLTKFIKHELIFFLGQLFSHLAASYREIMCEEDFVRIMFDH
jgi:hypothetical protein